MMIQVVGGHVGDHRNLRAAAHADQLEAGQLHHRDIRRGDPPDNGQQRPADVAAQMHRAARLPQHGGDQAGGGGLAVGTGHRHDLAGAEFKEQLHLAGDLGAGLARGLQFGGEELKAGVRMIMSCPAKPCI